MSVQRILTTLVSALMMGIVSIVLTGCCCGGLGDFQKELEEQAAKEIEKEIDKAAAEADEGDDDDDDEGDDDDDDEKDGKKADGDDDDAEGGGDAVAVGDMTQDNLEARLKGIGWEIASKSESNGNFFTFAVKKGSTFATVQLQQAKTKNIAKLTEKALKKTEGARVERDGKKLLYVYVLNNPDKADELINKIIGK